MNPFEALVPHYGDDTFTYLLWAIVTTIFALMAVAQIALGCRLGAYFNEAMKGQNRAGQILVERQSNAKWNDDVRAFCRTNGLRIVRRGVESDSV